MPVTVYYACPTRWDDYAQILPGLLAAAGVDAVVLRDAPDPAAVDYIVYAPSSPLQDFTPFVNVKAVLSLWAGVERIVGNASLTQPLCRMVDSGLTEGMVEWVVGHSLRHHLGMDRHIVNPGHVWDPTCPPLARQRPVAMLGLGALGLAAARAVIEAEAPRRLPILPMEEGRIDPRPHVRRQQSPIWARSGIGPVRGRGRGRLAPPP